MKLLWRRLANVLAVLAGMPALMACPKYGEPPVQITRFSYQPSGAIHVGDTLTFTAELPAGQLDATAFAGRPVVQAGLSVELHDDGVAPDTRAGDGIYTGAAPWLAKYGRGTMQTALWVEGEIDHQVHKGFHDGPPLEVKP